MRELFIYYRVRPASTARALDAVRTMQEALRTRHAGLQARLLRRPPVAGESETWMETYAGADVAALATVIEGAAAEWAGLVDGARHVEVFESLS